MAIIVHRVMARIYKNEPFGYSASAARWNPKGYPVIYTASQLSLCTTELMAIMGPGVRLQNWCHVTYRIKEPITFFAKEKLPPDWNSRPHAISTQNLGKDLLVSKKSTVVAVPSARLPLSAYPAEFNVLINPLSARLHSAVKVLKVEDFDFVLND